MSGSTDIDYWGAVLARAGDCFGHFMTGDWVQVRVAPNLSHTCHASLAWVTLDDPQKVVRKKQEVMRLATIDTTKR